jgi:hypothetical protein
MLPQAIAPLIFSAGKQTDVDAEAEALQRETALTVTDSVFNAKKWLAVACEPF